MAETELDDETLKRIAEVARLKLDDEEAGEIKKDMKTILAHFKKIQEIREGEEIFYVRDVHSELREDVAEKKEREDIVKQFNKKVGRHMAAPKALD